MTTTTDERAPLTLALSAVPDHDRIRDALDLLNREHLRRATTTAPPPHTT